MLHKGRALSWNAKTLVLEALLLIAVVAAATLPSSGAARPYSSKPRNIILFYDDYPTRGDPQFQITTEIARPIVTYVDRNGIPMDWMFDSFIFYSVYLYFDRNPTQAYIDSWIKYIFDGGQIANLDSAVAFAKVALKRPEYLMNVFLTIPVAPDNVSASAILGNVDKLINRWKALNPSNLNLVGFYWGFTESLCDVKGLAQIVPAIASYVHSMGYKLLIIPYRNYAWCNQNSYAYQDLQASYHRVFGFDYVTIQPNYAFDANSDLNDFAKVNDGIVHGFADGAELELPITEVKCCGGDWKSNVDTYLQQASQNGWNRALVQTYYHGSDISLMARYSDAGCRAAYEAIYQHILGTDATLTVHRRS